MIELLKIYEVPSIIALMTVIILLFKVIFKYMEIAEKNATAIQELTTWLKTRFDRGGHE